MTKRRRAREYALQLLFQLEFTGTISKFVDFWIQKKVDKETRDYAEELVRGTAKNLESLDRTIKNAAQHWDVGRMAAVDRNILRMGAFEILYRSDIPSAVAINEALEIAKKYSTHESASFINGILDRIAKDHKKAP